MTKDQAQRIILLLREAGATMYMHHIMMVVLLGLSLSILVVTLLQLFQRGV